MTQAFPDRAGAETSALARLVSDPADFAARQWGRAAHLHHGSHPGAFADLLTLDGVDELLTTRALRTPFVRVAKDGATVPERQFTAGGGAGAAVADQVSDDHLARLFADGSTIVLQGLHRSWAPLGAFARDLAAELGHPVQANAYVTPPQSRGFRAHYDVHDVFVLQVAGRKRWVIHEPVLTWPMRAEPWEAPGRRQEVERAARGEPLLDVVLEPGDCLYLPRGFLHAATALGDVSAHVTLGVHTWTARHVADAVVERALAAATRPVDGLRAPLPLGVDLGDPGSLASVTARVRDALIEAVRAVRTEDVAADLAEAAGAAGRAEPLPPLAQAAAARAADAGTWVRARRHTVTTRSTRPGGEVDLVGRAGRVVVPADLASGLDVALDGDRHRPGDLPLPPEAALDLVRLLLRSGLVVADGAESSPA